ncbi:helix-turn-helix domain-containing protein [Acinetobacter towneri]|uniref:helix-turn-helix domain-containing protein n=1 Tax=Acinetobacter towneri TaxID=202956 RepID=UPI001D180B45|nr:helix-turn-helix domain-containing protein [Acinetobacter towneri]
MSIVSIINDEYDVDMSIVKMEQVASHLVGLLRHQKISRSELAQKLGWSKGRVTKVLSGDVNLTIKTITTITSELGYDFDIVFHNKKYERPKQPWQIDRGKAMSVPVLSQQMPDKMQVVLQIETGDQVVESVLAGKEKPLYISVSNLSEILQPSSIPVAKQIPPDNSPINITYFKPNMKVVHHE